MVFLGNSGVGKTSFIQRYCTGHLDRKMNTTVGRFSFFYHFVINTINTLLCVNDKSLFPGIDFQMKTLTLGSTNITLQLWDTAGQERSEYWPSYSPFQSMNCLCLICTVCYSDFAVFIHPGFAASQSSTTAKLTASSPCMTWLTPPPSPLWEGGWTLWRWAGGDHMGGCMEKTCKTVCLNLNAHAGKWQ